VKKRDKLLDNFHIAYKMPKGRQSSKEIVLTAPYHSY